MFQAVILGVVQGLTEFVPVSSSAHLVLVPFLFRWPVPSLAFDVAVHLGTALAVVVYFGADLLGILRGAVRTISGRGMDRDRADARLIPLLVVGTVPAAVAGLLLEGLFEDLFTGRAAVDRAGAPLTALLLVGTAALLLSAEAVYGRRTHGHRGMDSISVMDALVIGLFQAVAILPGISRSGATIGAGMFRGLSREAAARFSFLLSLPAILGAAIIALPDLPPEADLGPFLVGAAAASVAGFAAIAFLLTYLRTRTMRPFALYCLVVAVVALGAWLVIR
jgi:undecaprenyl-diphosphatase